MCVLTCTVLASVWGQHMFLYVCVCVCVFVCMHVSQVTIHKLGKTSHFDILFVKPQCVWPRP